ncbi:metalloendopeptidase [Heliocybe sulcata]|uniref:CAAX prenyl protease n=1 Tax=Heliocybe sulcata TaxID=5364 RepID=A0A5C3N2S6_9AGAM|nr:metalloendopeptidase [Heliocybe sulcata]
MDFLHTLLGSIQNKLSWVQVQPINWKLYVQSFSWGVTLFESYLLLRQYPLYSKTAPPPILEKYFEKDTFEKSQKYGKDKAKFSLFAGLYKQVVDSAMIQYGAYAWSWEIAGRILSRFGYGAGYEISQSILFSAVLFFISSIPSLPLSVYQTFVLEEKHGFNKTTPGLFVADMVKGWAVGFAIGAPFLAVFLKIFKWAGDRFVPWLMGFLLAFQMSMVVLYPTVIQPLFNKLSPLSEGALRGRIESMASKLKFPLKHLYEIDGSKRSSHSNAYFFGLPWSKHIVIFDTLIKESPPEDIEAVLAHELGHWYYIHPTKLLLISQAHIFTILSLFPAFLHAPPLLASFDFPSQVAKNPPTVVAFLLFQMILTPLEAVVGIGLNFISRQFEWQADRFATELPAKLSADSASGKLQLDEVGKKEVDEMADMGERLKRALIQLHVKNLSTVWVDWLYSAYHHSHPTLMERLKAIEVLQKNVPVFTVDAKKEL